MHCNSTQHDARMTRICAERARRSARDFTHARPMLTWVAISTAFVAPSTFDLGHHRDLSVARPSLTRTQWRLPAGISSAAVARPAGGRRAQRRFGREALAAKGVAGMVLLRFAYSSPLSAALAIALSFVVAVAPVGSVEAVLLAGLLCLLGTASYWPANVLVYALSSAGAAGCLNGCLMWWEKRRRQSKPGQRRGDRRSKKDRLSNAPDTVPEDESGGLLALAAGAILAAIFGALG